MSDVARNPPRDFWQPPVSNALSIPAIASVPAVALATACTTCTTEFMVGAAFCHSCGAIRPALFPQESFFEQDRDSLVSLAGHRIKAELGLSGASLVAFLFGIGCMLLAIVVGIASGQSGSSQLRPTEFWRIQWLLAAVAAFTAGILLKRPDAGQK